ncbi:NYN domain-containing protein [Allomeiothermus silvanus]|uniref:LabA-like NYN domain-containing protein n=1 Tax=Allomeiothermus silvanus TaxID=52022 RepID=UPI0005A0CE28|nr:NYN domain-containing protein [Allomeiothermus silvanus]
MRIALFIDGSYMYNAAKRLGWNVDHRRVIGQFATPEELYNAFYYAPITDSEDERQQKFLDALVFMGYTVRSREVRGEPRFEALIATDMLITAPRWDRAVVASGAGELAHALGALRAQGKELYLVGVAELTDLWLRNQADRFLDLRDMREGLERQGGGRRMYPGYSEETVRNEPEIGGEALVSPHSGEEQNSSQSENKGRGLFESLEDEL